MNRPFLRRGAVGLSLGALSVAGLASVPASAVITDGEVFISAYAGDASGDPTCVLAASSNSTPAEPWTDNGVTVTRTEQDAGVITAPGGDVSSVGATVTSSANATPIAGGPATISVRTNQSSRAAASTPLTVCEGEASSRSEIDGDFVLPQAMWATVAWDNTGSGETYSYLSLNLEDGYLYFETPARSKGTITALLPAGDVSLSHYGETESEATTPGRQVATLSESITISLRPLGAASAVDGKGKGYVALGARTCGAGTIDASLTKKAKKKASQVTIAVNGSKVAKFKGKKVKPRSLVLPAAPASDANVTATIKLKKNGKKVEVSRSYLAC